MLLVPLVTIVAREMRLKIVEVDQALQVLWVPRHDDGARNASEIHWELELLRVPLVAIVAWEMRLKFFWSRPSFGDVASTASREIGARNAIENFLKSTNVWRCCQCR